MTDVFALAQVNWHLVADHFYFMLTISYLCYCYYCWKIGLIRAHYYGSGCRRERNWCFYIPFYCFQFQNRLAFMSVLTSPAICILRCFEFSFRHCFPCLLICRICILMFTVELLNCKRFMVVISSSDEVFLCRLAVDRKG